ncbi:MAG: T9SS type A sorting domain-containing protein, partial [Bacteroidales bacterium]
GSNTWMPVISTLIGNTINHNLTDLTPNIDYEFKAYATTASGTTYGTIKSFITLGINGAHENKISIMVYPNPANSQTNLIITGISGETKITLSDIQGRTLNTINTKAISRILEQNIDLNNLAKGIYYIRIQNSDINKTQKLIVK